VFASTMIILLFLAPSVDTRSCRS